jgi:hypothetical protein
MKTYSAENVDIFLIVIPLKIYVFEFPYIFGKTLWDDVILRVTYVSFLD